MAATLCLATGMKKAWISIACGAKLFSPLNVDQKIQMFEERAGKFRTYKEIPLFGKKFE